MTAVPASHPAVSRLRLFGIEADRFTGAGIIQRTLADGLDARLGPTWSLDHQNGQTSMAHRLLAGRTGRADASIWVSTPLPIKVPSDRHAHFVFDLRWRNTRSSVGAAYRAADLKRILKRSHHIFTISRDVERQINDFASRQVPMSVVPMGPGQMEGRSPVPITDHRTIVMIGRARHKRNEELADLLANSSLVRLNYRVVAISVSEETRRRLASSGVSVEFHDDVNTSTLAELLERSSVYIALTTDEGFGLPYVEAAYCGTDVIAVDGAVAREALGDHAVLLPESAPRVADIEHAIQAWSSVRVEQLTDEARRRSWRDAVDHVADWVLDGGRG